ncbi:MAG: sulfatase-like hydrolase/transferase [Verrucomicrobiae bacterium]|nr:sulfatase-like hydrolase/transferase [Verrucomicrobiae bacterium]
MRFLSTLTGLGVACTLAAAAAMAVERPNILWLTWEDAGPQLGAYGDAYATTPNLDALASRGMRYRRVWSTAPVCAPARTAIISGMYPASIGAEHMRSDVPMRAGTRMYPELLREAGYHCSNNSKEDYNLRKPPGVWDESSPRAHWRNRAPGQPFFAIFNYTESHESQTRRRPHTIVHDPARAPVPPYQPDEPEVREGWAQYYDQVSVVDRRVKAALDELEEAGLAGDTIVFAYADHGPGLPRGKRMACDSGLRVPLIVHFPERWRHLAPREYAVGGESPRLVGFVDLAPTVLSLAGVRPPDWMQGRAFAGPHQTRPPGWLFGSRARMDERIDLVRAATDGRYVYVRNYLPHLPHGQRVAYLFQTPMTQAWHRRFEEGTLSPIQRAFWEPRAPEELYDLESDPHETVNLAESGPHRSVLERFRRVHRRQVLSIGDLGFLPEAEMLARTGEGSPGDLVAAGRYDVWTVFRAAELAAGRGMEAVSRLRRMTGHGDSAVRYWAATGLHLRGVEAVRAGREALRGLLGDGSGSVRVAAAEALAWHGDATDRAEAIRVLAQDSDLGRSEYLVAVAALNALDRLKDREALPLEALRALPTRPEGVSGRMSDYVERLLERVRKPEAGSLKPEA